ncbi:hypothetical protein DUNSADRAFT_4286 [Dunaliella salina]|uniref:Encoded protein n=1 Tax=Dunaliella salina TaxID=3046 RepID=A0ABQ7GS92_DUNSA|nr:hypothetical protein DUNSADRAFT_4286 [Dunaliella salina]|eukprot:KAF5837484.1 hypothetical protein DUNSADRAFT_4286 [Dunaliella salina]
MFELRAGSPRCARSSLGTRMLSTTKRSPGSALSVRMVPAPNAVWLNVYSSVLQFTRSLRNGCQVKLTSGRTAALALNDAMKLYSF